MAHPSSWPQHQQVHLITSTLPDLQRPAALATDPCYQHDRSDSEASPVSLVAHRAARWAFWSAAQAL
jgi:hypothetical protein